ncbi:MAG: Kef-type K+ transport system membrane component KefB [Gammaproteobacteria bacterium]|jgi:Kef-type K+ transport system membrane component KefB
MSSGSVIFSIFLIFAGAAVLATMALYARQAMIVAYIFVGVILGPWGGGLIDDPTWIEDVSEIGIMFLLYLLGINMLPQQLWKMLAEALQVTLLSCVAFAVIGFSIATAFGFVWHEALIIGCTMMFSSTIIGLKLLPTTTLHHQHTGQVIISVLLLQDLFAILVLLVIQGYGLGDNPLVGVARELVALPVLIAIAYALERWMIEPLLRRFDQIQEYIFLLVIAWCLGIAELAATLGLSHEIGAFIAGVALASCPAAMFIADSLRPLRDFFLILFFFSLGAGFNPAMMPPILMPGLALAGAMLILKPIIFRVLLVRAGERRRVSAEIGARLGQVSEFSLLIAVLAFESGIIAERASYVIQFATLLTFIVSSYWIVRRHPTPIAVRDSLRRD